MNTRSTNAQNTPPIQSGPSTAKPSANDYAALEAHADSLASAAMSDGLAPKTGACPCGGGCSRCAGQTSSSPNQTPSLSGELGPSKALDNTTQQFMAQRFGEDFSGVQVYDTAQANAAVDQMGANAFTYGDHIAFNSGLFNPSSPNGRDLLAHELAHVVQQRQGLSEPRIQKQDGPGTRGSSAGEAVIVLGRWDQQISIPGMGTVTLPTEGSQALLRGQAVEVFPGREPGEVMALPGAFGTEPGQGAFPRVAEQGRAEADRERTGPPGFRGLPSGVAVQEALEGGLTRRGHRVTAIYMNVDNVDLEHGGQTSSEYRQIVAALASGNNTNVDIVIRHGSQTSRIRRGTQVVDGDPLPASLRPHLPPSFRTLGPRGGGSGGSDDGDDGPIPPRVRRTPPPSSSTPAASRPPRRPSATGTRVMPRAGASQPIRPPRLPSSVFGGGRPGASRISPGQSAEPVATGLARGAANAVGDIVGIIVEQWIQEELIDPQNRAAFEADLRREQPRIDRMVRHHRADAQRIRASGGVPYAVVTLHVVYRTFTSAFEDGLSHSSFQDLWVREVDVEDAPREGTANPHRDQSLLEHMLDPEVLGRNFREEDHTLITYSYELPDSGTFARQSTTELAESLVEMHRYLANLIAGQTEAPPEAAGVAFQMRRAIDRAIDFNDPEATAALRRELLIFAEEDEGVVNDIFTLAQTVGSQSR